MEDVIDAKRELRRRMRALLSDLDDRDGRSRRVRDVLAPLVDAAGDGAILLYEALPTEPDIGSIAGRLREGGRRVLVTSPTPDAAAPLDPSELGVVVLPGLAFSRRGDRLGRGGGWYDRVLARCRPECLVVGACFDRQLVTALPVEPHDIVMDAIVTESGVVDFSGS